MIYQKYILTKVGRAVGIDIAVVVDNFAADCIDFVMTFCH